MSLPPCRRSDAVNDSFIQGIGGQIGSIGPTNRTVFIDKYLAKNRRIAKWFKHWPKEAVAQRNNSVYSVTKSNCQPITIERLD